MSVKLVEGGDIFESEMKTITNATNTVGVMGAGLAKAFKERYPKYFEDYAEKCENGEAKVPYLYVDESGKQIISFPTMVRPGQEGSYRMIESGLEVVKQNWDKWDIESLALPALGCGIGNLEFNAIWIYVYRVFNNYRHKNDCKYPVEVYAPL